MWDGEYLSIIIQRVPCGDKRAGFDWCLNHQRAERQTGDNPIALWKGKLCTPCSFRVFRHKTATGVKYPLREVKIFTRENGVVINAAAENRNGGNAGGYRLCMRNRVN